MYIIQLINIIFKLLSNLSTSNEKSVVEFSSDHISNWKGYVYKLASNSSDHVSDWKCVVLKSDQNFGQMSFFLVT